MKLRVYFFGLFPHLDLDIATSNVSEAHLTAQRYAQHGFWALEQGKPARFYPSRSVACVDVLEEES